VRREGFAEESRGSNADYHLPPYVLVLGCASDAAAEPEIYQISGQASEQGRHSDSQDVGRARVVLYLSCLEDGLQETIRNPRTCEPTVLDGAAAPADDAIRYRRPYGFDKGSPTPQLSRVKLPR